MKNSRFFENAIVIFFLLAAATVQAEHIVRPPTIRLGVLAFKPKLEVIAQWQPIAAYLEKSLQIPVSLSAYTYDELNKAASLQEVDVVVTNPGHYVQLNSRGLLKPPVATLIKRNGQSELQSFGGVIFTKAGSEINSLGDIAGKRIAAVSIESLGGYQMQAYELHKSGIDLDKKSSVIIKTGVPHSLVVDAVMTGRAEVGFIRDTVLESMIKTGKIKAEQLRIINRQYYKSFPYIVSTPLYPEWPVAVSTNLDEHIARALTVALLSLKPDDPANISSDIHGFSSPADYRRIEELLRELRISPFDGIPKFTLNDFWNRHFVLITSILALLLIIGSAMLILLYFQSRRARQSRNRFSRLFELSPEPIWLLRDGLFVDCNSAAVNLLGYKYKHELIGKSPLDFSPVYQTDGISSNAMLDTIRQKLNKDVLRFDWIHTTAAGTQIVVKISLAPISLEDSKVVLAVGHDMTETVQNEERIKLASSVFLHAKEGILITAPSGEILDVNNALIRFSGYSREELIGSDPKILQSGKQSRDFYSGMWQSILQHGYWTGEILNKTKEGLDYPGILTISSVKNSEDETTHFVGHFTDITHIKEQEEKLRLLAHYDPLTGLPNRTMKALRLNQAISLSKRSGRPLAVIFIDLDEFKTVNDEHGHDVGDELLVKLSQRLSRALREGDTLARLGGDEFVAILSELEKPNDVETILNRLLAAASEKVATTCGEVQVSASIGVTLFPQDASDADQLLRHADMAMYQAKLAGKNRFQYFDVDQDRAAQKRIDVIADVKAALTDHQFVLYYQPKMDMRKNQVIGVEALIRWMHPERGLIPPLDFLPHIENYPVEIELGDWVIDEAIKQCGIWKNAGLNLTISVNVGANQLQQTDFAAKLARCLNLNPDVPPSLIELEILESAALKNIQETSDILHSCRNLGVGIALDDFGTGYSSLSYLRQLPAEWIKIDQSFVRDMLADPDDLSIVESVIGLAHSFRRKVIAEGVESHEHGAALLSLGCDFAQGYGISRPLPALALEAWLENSAQSFRQYLCGLPGLHESAIVFAEVGHRAWVSRIEAFLALELDSPPPMSPSDCHLGRWIESDGKAFFGGLPAFNELVKLHEHVHDLGRDLISSQGGAAEIRDKLSELKTLRDEVIQKLRLLCRPDRENI